MNVRLNVSASLTLPDHIFFAPGIFTQYSDEDFAQKQHLACATAYIRKFPDKVRLQTEFSEQLRSGTIALTEVDVDWDKLNPTFHFLLDLPYVSSELTKRTDIIASIAAAYLRNDTEKLVWLAERTEVLSAMVDEEYNMRFLYGTVWRDLMYGASRVLGMPPQVVPIAQKAIGWVQSSG